MEGEWWRWIWLAVTAVFGIGEIFTAGFFLLPFSAGALVAFVLAWFEIEPTLVIIVFMVVSIMTLVLIQRLVRKGETLGEAFRLAAFVEKPDEQTARQYLDSGAYLWNSGIFVLRAERWLALIGHFRPDILEACRLAQGAGTRDLDFFRPDADQFRRCPSESVDYAVMEPYAAEAGADARVIPLDAGWSDVGAWASLWEVSTRDAAGNAIHGDVYTHDASGNLLNAQHRLVAAVGVRDLVVVETADAVLVADKARAQVAELLDTANRSSLYSASLKLQEAAIAEPELTPSARVLREMREKELPFFRPAMAYSEHWAHYFRARTLAPQVQAAFEAETRRSMEAQRDIERAAERDTAPQYR